MTTESGEVRRGTVISFDPVLWQAKILMDGGDVEATLAVGSWVLAHHLTVGVNVAIIFFGETDYTDAVVLGAYGQAAAPVLDVDVTAGDAVLRAETTTSGNAQLQLWNGGSQLFYVLADRTNNRLTLQSAVYDFMHMDAGGGNVQLGGGSIVFNQQLVNALANNATITISNTGKTRTLFISDNAGSQAIFFLNGAGSTVLAVQDGAAFSITSGTAGKSNVYYAGGQFTLENKSGGPLNYWLTWIGQA